MKIHRFIIDKDLDAKKLEIADQELFNQFNNVLRLSIGSRITVSDGKGREALAQITSLNKGSVSLELQEAVKNNNDPLRYVILYCSLLKRENFELVVQKATEVGVREIFPVITERTVKFNVKMERLQKIMKEAAEQSGRGVLPKISEPIRFGQAMEHGKHNDLNWFLDISGLPLKKGLVSLKPRLGVFVGPEGGWTGKELVSAKGDKFKVINLGKLTLRAETAAVVASYLATSL